MPQLLTSYVRSYLQGKESLLRRLEVPVLVWEPREGEVVPESTSSVQMTETGERAWLTEAGKPRRRPKSGDPLVFEIKRGANSRSALGMGVAVGRVEHNDICIPDPSISRFHAWFELSKNAQDWMLADAGSRNGTWINALRLEPKVPTVVTTGALVRFGDIQMTFHRPHTFIQYLEQVMAR